MRKKKKQKFSGMVIILLITCIGVVFVLMRILVGREDFYIGRNRMAGEQAEAVGNTVLVQTGNGDISGQKEADAASGVGDVQGGDGKSGAGDVQGADGKSGADDVQGADGKSGADDVSDTEGTSATEKGNGSADNSGGLSGEQFIGEATLQTGFVSQMEPESYEFTVSDKSYFDDALFIGDSRTVGLREFGTLDNADYFASSGLNLYTIEKTKAVFGEEQKLTLEEILDQHVYGKIYVMLGINELGYDFDTTVEKYQLFIDYLFSKQPDAILYVCANLHVNGLRNEVDEIHNNEAINRMNEVIASFADQKDIFYLDVNPLFDDKEGNLAEEYISDDSHLLGTYYEDWCDWYCENTIVKTQTE